MSSNHHPFQRPSGHRPPGLTPLRPPRSWPWTRNWPFLIKRMLRSPGTLVLLGFVLTLLLLVCWSAPARVLQFLQLLGCALLGGLCGLALVVGTIRFLHISARRRSARPVPPARVHEAPLHSFSPLKPGPSSQGHASPHEHFYSYEPLNERPSEQFRPDQRSRC